MWDIDGDIASFNNLFSSMASTDLPDDLSHRQIIIGVRPVSTPFPSKTHP